MKKNKTIAYMLAATLLVGGTFVGTKALFTDVEQVAGELKISTGDIDIEVVEDSGWVLDRNGNEYANGTTVKGETGIGPINLPETKDFANNIKPGDVLTKKITIKNVGTLIADVNLVKDTEVDLGVLEGFLKLEETLVNGEDVHEATLIPNEEITVELKISANGSGLHNEDESYNKDSIEQQTINLTNAWTLEAVQQDDKDLGFGQN